MTAAIYARKSTDQTGVADEQKCVAHRGLEHGRRRRGRGWRRGEVMFISRFRLALLVVLVAVVQSTACSRAERIVTTLADVDSGLRKAGFEIGNHEEKFAGMIGAQEGYGLPINGNSIEVYRYGTHEGAENGKHAAEEMKRALVKQMGGDPPAKGFAVAVSNVLVITDDHPNAQQIVKAVEAIIR